MGTKIVQHNIFGEMEEIRTKKTIFGNGFLLSDRLAAERLAAERLAADRLAAREATVWELSERENEIIKRLSANP